ncbi:hypothetical protein T4A_11037 [Trichinella pseudospiralis]|uniref:Uncharacterized protein n=1 Tax=Trichinella pseudospiralis TaxID=6337 RepID=A0A0V1DK65_TRIPS|nr:hypothetical protein T4A_11037 [Trichinella pseudospiralis]
MWLEGGGGQIYGAIKFKSWESRMLKFFMWHIVGIMIVNGYASGYAACQLNLTFHLHSFAP